MAPTRSQHSSARTASVRICDQREVDFTQRYVCRRHASLAPDMKSLGERSATPVIRECIFEQDYAKTLAIRRSNFRAACARSCLRNRTDGVGLVVGLCTLRRSIRVA
jgi:hypothetical protein